LNIYFTIEWFPNINQIEKRKFCLAENMILLRKNGGCPFASEGCTRFSFNILIESFFCIRILLPNDLFRVDIPVLSNFPGLQPAAEGKSVAR
jgi:hypothetical protein